MDKKAIPKKRKLKYPLSLRDKVVLNKELKKNLKQPMLKKILHKIAVFFKQATKIKGLKLVFKILRLISLIIYPRYIRNSFKELQDVTWPKFHDSLKLTYAVIIFAVLFGAAVALVDLGLGKIFKIILLK